MPYREYILGGKAFLKGLAPMSEPMGKSEVVKPEHEPFTGDETIVRKIGNTTYILTAKYKQGASEGAVDKLLRLIEYGLEDLNK